MAFCLERNRSSRPAQGPSNDVVWTLLRYPNSNATLW